jgi:glutathione S-transferase
MALTLYYSPGACSLAPHIVLEETGAVFSLVLVATDKGETRTAAFKAINAKGRVPVLDDGGHVVTEASAILLHLGQLFPEKGLLPPSGAELVAYVELCNWLSSTVHGTAVRMIWRPEAFCEDQHIRPAIVEKGREYLSDAFGQIESRMTSRSWALGEIYSVADPYLLVFYRWGNRMKIDMRKNYPAWTGHALKMEARPAVVRALKTEGVSLWE